MFDFNWALFQTEFAVIGLALGLLMVDIAVKDKADRGKIMADCGMIGLALLLAQLPFQWGVFGRSFSGSFVQDGVTFFFKMLFMMAAFYTLFMSRHYQDNFKRGHGEFTLLVLFSLIGMLFLAAANDFLLFFVALETLTISMYILTAYLRDRTASIEAGVKYLVLGAISTAVFLFGLSFIYGATGSTSYVEIQDSLSKMASLPATFLFGMVLVICSLAFKISAVPFHFWAPDVYQGAPSPVTAYLAIGSKIAGFAALVRLMLSVFEPAAAPLVLLFSVIAALTIIYGNLGALPQTNIKRLMAYSSIGHAGYMLIGLATFSQTGKEALLYYLASYLVSTAGVFLVIVAVTNHFKTRDIAEFAGLSKRSPLLAAGMLLALLSLAGVPPLAGFFAKFYLLWCSVESGLLWLTVIGALNVVTSLYYYLKIVKVMYVDEPVDAKPIRLTLDQKILQYITIAGILFLGIYQAPVVQLAHAVFLNLK